VRVCVCVGEREGVCVVCACARADVYCLCAISPLDIYVYAGYTGPVGGPCSPCLEGGYKAESGSESCLLCPDNSVSSLAAVEIAACRCKAGYVGSDGGTCTACAAGSYKMMLGDAACVKCAANATSATAADAASSCICNGGYYAQNDGCVECAQGFYRTAGASETACSKCPQNADTYGTASFAATSCVCNGAFIGAPGEICTNPNDTVAFSLTTAPTPFLLPPPGTPALISIEISLPMTATDFKAQESTFIEALALAAGVEPSDVIIKSVREVTTNRRTSRIGFTSYSARSLLATSVEVVAEIQTNNAAVVMNQLKQESLTAQLSLVGLPAPTAFAAEAQAAPAKSVQQVSQPYVGNNKKTELFLIAVVVAAVAVVGFVVRACAGVLVKCIGKGGRIRGEGDLVPKTIFLVDAENTSATNFDLCYEVQVATTIAIEDLPTPPLPDAYARIEPSVLGKVQPFSKLCSCPPPPLALSPFLALSLPPSLPPRPFPFLPLPPSLRPSLPGSHTHKLTRTHTHSVLLSYTHTQCSVPPSLLAG